MLYVILFIGLLAVVITQKEKIKQIAGAHPAPLALQKIDAVAYQGVTWDIVAPAQLPAGNAGGLCKTPSHGWRGKDPAEMPEMRCPTGREERPDLRAYLAMRFLRFQKEEQGPVLHRGRTGGEDLERENRGSGRCCDGSSSCKSTGYSGGSRRGTQRIPKIAPVLTGIITGYTFFHGAAARASLPLFLIGIKFFRDCIPVKCFSKPENGKKTHSRGCFHCRHEPVADLMR